MGMRDFLDKMKKKAQDRLNPKPLTPEEEKARKQTTARKQFEQLNGVIEFGKKALKIKKDVDTKVDGIKDGIAEKTIKIVDKIEGAAPADTPAGTASADDAPAQEPKKPGVISKGVSAVKQAGVNVAGKAKDIAQAQRAAAARKPSTRSGILDLIVPAVPDTQATAPKKPATGADCTPPAPAGKGTATPPRPRKPKS